MANPDGPRSSMSVFSFALHLGVLQFFLLLTWTVYAIYLPGLLISVGIEKQWAPWILLADQITFAIFDVAAGFAADRAFRLYARIGKTLVVASAVSGIAFLLLPWMSWGAAEAGWRAPVFLGLTMVWVITSAALRSPVFGLLSRHASKAQAPQMAGIALAGMALAAALSPYFGLWLKALDPRLPFALSSLVLFTVACTLVAAERRLSEDASEIKAGAPQTLTSPTAVDGPGSVSAPFRSPSFIGLVFVAALAFQWAVNINAGPRFLLEFSAADLPWLFPVFWVGFSFTAFSAGRFSRRFGAVHVFAVACLIAGTGFGITQLPGAQTVLFGYLLAGLGWGVALPAAFGIASDLGRPQRIASITGFLFGALGLAGFARVGLNLSGATQAGGWLGNASAVPFVLWFLVGGTLLWLLARRSKA